LTVRTPTQEYRDARSYEFINPPINMFVPATIVGL